CLGHDYPWIAVTVTLDLTVAVGYMLIARHWWLNERLLPDVPARRALASIRNIFLFCGLCGYIFIPIKMFWPAWRLYDLFMLALAYYTWRYAFRSAEMRVVYTELGKSTRLAEELDAAREESKRKSSFLNAISHDLRTPLNGLMLQASLADLNADANDAEGLRDALKGMRASARATSDMLDTLLEFARLDWTTDANRCAPFALRDAVAAACDPFRPDAAVRGIYLRDGCPLDLVVTTDRQKLERVLANLVGNAVKFTPAGGVRVEVAAAGAAVEIHVVDTGVGIDPATHDRLFDEFFQVHNHERDRRKGFGLGLSIARRLARQLGGDLSVESAVGRGSRFTVALPDVAGARPAAAGGEPAGGERTDAIVVVNP
ncbi:MAG: hypothetical protein JWO31_680, partial [Phycisphaerales bacterium]|nr:hypothetical protein [Phycisphaerales bacterium]